MSRFQTGASHYSLLGRGLTATSITDHPLLLRPQPAPIHLAQLNTEPITLDSTFSYPQPKPHLGPYSLSEPAAEHVSVPVSSVCMLQTLTLS